MKTLIEKQLAGAFAQCHLVFPNVGRTPWSAADALVGLVRRTSLIWLVKERVHGDPRGPGGPPHLQSINPSTGKTK